MLQKLKAKEVLNNFKPLKKSLAKLAGVSAESDIDTILRKIAEDEDKLMKAAAITSIINALTWLITYSITKRLLEVDNSKSVKHLILFALRQITSMISYLNYYVASRLEIIPTMELLTGGAIMALVFGDIPDTIAKKLGKLKDYVKKLASKIRKTLIKNSSVKETLDELKHNEDALALSTRLAKSIFTFTTFFIYSQIKALIHVIITGMGLREYEWIVAVLVSTLLFILDKRKHPFSGTVRIPELLK